MQKTKKAAALAAFATILILLFTACGPAIGSDGYPYPGLTETIEEPMGEATEPLGEATEAMTPEAGETPTEMMEETPLIPETGEVDPGRLTNLMGFEVLTADGTKVGDVDDLVLNLTDLRVDYVVVQMIPVPWEALEVVMVGADGMSESEDMTAGMAKGAFTLLVDQAAFDNAPTFDLTAIPLFGASAEGWDAEIVSYWENIIETPAAAATPMMENTPSFFKETVLQGVILASNLIGFEVNFSAGTGQVSSSIDDILIDVPSGDLRYIVVSWNSSSVDKLVPIPLSVLSFTGSTAAVGLSQDATVLENAPSFEGGAYPDTQSTDWDAEIRTYWESMMGTGTTTQ